MISLGEGQEPVALKAINAGAVNGTWVLLQNCELGLGLMNDMESIINKLKGSLDPNFRLFTLAELPLKCPTVDAVMNVFLVAAQVASRAAPLLNGHRAVHLLVRPISFPQLGDLAHHVLVVRP